MRINSETKAIETIKDALTLKLANPEAYKRIASATKNNFNREDKIFLVRSFSGISMDVRVDERVFDKIYEIVHFAEAVEDAKAKAFDDYAKTR